MAQKEDRRLGSIIGGKWRVDAVLGTGSMATVYAVTHRNGVHAALKILHPTLCTDAKVCERFLGEGYLTNQVKHPGIVRVLDDGMTDDGCVFLVMDLLEGKTLEALRQDCGGKIDVEQTLDIAEKLMDALHAVHSAGIIHRDLKPQNVFVCDDGSVKLLDFGVARVLENASANSKMSLFGMVLGTPSFMSPEQATGARDQVDHRADIYSLGATMFTSLTGETVHLGPHVQAKLLAAGTVQARSIGVVKQDLSAPLVNVIDTALRFDKADRWQSVESFRRAMREARNATKAATPSKKMQTIDKGPKRTFIGVGGEGSGKFPPAPAPVPAKSTLPYGVEPSQSETQPVPAPLAMQTKTEKFPVSRDPHAGHSGAAKALPVAIVRKPVSVDEPLLDEHRGDESYPAVHTPVPAYDETEALMSQLQGKRSNVGFVFASLALIAAAIGGVAFFAMGGHTSASNSDDPNMNMSPATLTSAPAPIAEPAPSFTVGHGDDKETRDAGAGSSVTGSTAHPPAHAAISPPPAWHPRLRTQPTQGSNSLPNSTPNPSTYFPRPPVSPEPPPVNNPAPAATPTVSSDPFSTPE